MLGDIYLNTKSKTQESLIAASIALIPFSAITRYEQSKVSRRSSKVTIYSAKRGTGESTGTRAIKSQTEKSVESTARA